MRAVLTLAAWEALRLPNGLSLGTTLKVLISSVWHCFVFESSRNGAVRVKNQPAENREPLGRGQTEAVLKSCTPATGSWTCRGNLKMRHEEGWKHKPPLTTGQLWNAWANAHPPQCLVVTSLMFQQQWVRAEIVWTLESSLNPGCDNH